MKSFGLRNFGAAALLATLLPMAHAGGGPLIGLTKHGDAILDCLTVANEVDFDPQQAIDYPVILKGHNTPPIYVEGQAHLDAVRGIVIVTPQVVNSADGKVFNGVLTKLAYRADNHLHYARLLPSNECARKPDEFQIKAID